ncbi:MAG: hypothetical protein H0T79_14090, partial [Deltaproteobacteria bacterium]|nr:hypothetical protein [Deltaproteobacteria bacterium]
MPDYRNLETSQDPGSEAAVALVRAWLDPDSNVRGSFAAAIGQLVATRGSVRPLALDLAAVLSDAATEAAIGHRAAVLGALHALAVGFDPCSALAHGIDAAWLDVELSAGMTQRQLRAPILARVKTILPLLGDREALVRIGVAQLLSVLPEVKADAIAALDKALAGEVDSLAQSHLLVALAAFGERREATPLPTKSDAVRVAARLARVLHGVTDPTLPTDAQHLPMVVEWFPGGDDPRRVIAATLVGRAYRVRDGASLDELATRSPLPDLIAVFALESL